MWPPWRSRWRRAGDVCFWPMLPKTSKSKSSENLADVEYLRRWRALQTDTSLRAYEGSDRPCVNRYDLITSPTKWRSRWTERPSCIPEYLAHADKARPGSTATASRDLPCRVASLTSAAPPLQATIIRKVALPLPSSACPSLQRAQDAVDSVNPKTLVGWLKRDGVSLNRFGIPKSACF